MEDWFLPVLAICGIFKLASFIGEMMGNKKGDKKEFFNNTTSPTSTGNSNGQTQSIQKYWNITRNIYKNSPVLLEFNNVYSLGIYYPKSDPSFDEYSKTILALKDKYGYAIDFFHYEIVSIAAGLLTGKTLCEVPSSDGNNPVSGMTLLVWELCHYTGSLDGTSCLYRTVSVPKAHLHRGTRNKMTHIRTIELHDRHLIEGRDVVVFDDVYTSGASMEACRDILFQNGALSVTGFVLGRTRRTR